MQTSLIPESLLAERDSLLQESLRPSAFGYSITSEYPIVLHPHKLHYSYGLFSADKQLLAHANFWPRQLRDIRSRNFFPVAFIGNVATVKSERNKGYMHNLLQDLSNLAQKMGAKALFLWSDLVEFYHKQGYEPLGKEFRFSFSRDKFSHFKNGSGCVWKAFREPSLEKVQTLLRLRYPLDVQVLRSGKEFLELLKIPDSILVCNQSFTSFFVIGKGFDMVGVIHEWGFVSVESLLSAVSHVLEVTGWPQLMLLSPVNLPSQWLRRMNVFANKVEEHHVALGKILDESIRPIISDMFIWGLDSI